MLGFKRLTRRSPLVGIELMHMIKRQMVVEEGNEGRAAELFSWRPNPFHRQRQLPLRPPE